MEKSNKKDFFLAALLSMMISITTILAVVFYLDNVQMEKQILKRETLIEETIYKGSLLLKDKSRNDSIVEKYIDDCGILINNKKVSTDELLQFVNSQINECDKLKMENLNLLDSLEIYKTYINLSKKNLNVAYSTKKSDDKITSTISISSDSLSFYKKLNELAKRDYGIIYTIEKNNGQTYFIKKYSKADSALFVYKYYKHVLSGDSLGNLFIVVPHKNDQKKSKVRDK